MKRLPYVIFFFILVGIGIANNKPATSPERITDQMTTASCTEAEDRDDSEIAVNTWESPKIPEFLAHYMDSASWCADTICVIDGKAYYYASDDYGRTNVIYTMDKLLCEDPALWYNQDDTFCKTKFYVNTASRSMVVDFANPQSVKKLQLLSPRLKGTKRFKKDYFAQLAPLTMYHIELDLPSADNVYDNNICRWLVQKVNKSFWIDESNSMDQDANAMRKLLRWNYTGNPHDMLALGRFASEKFFAIKKVEYGELQEDYPYGLYSALSLRFVSTNGRYWSYQKQTHEYGGGVHGYFTESVISFDAASNREINWDYLFVPDCEKKVLALFYKTVQQHSRFRWGVGNMSIADIREYFLANIEHQRDGHIVLPQPGLTDEGIVFSYQPYEISGFAMGTFHFCIPYDELKPYLTKQAKELFGM